VPVGSLIAEKWRSLPLIGILHRTALAGSAAAFSEDPGPRQCGPGNLAGLESRVPRIACWASGFDFYVLALSWSPAYCLAEGAAPTGSNALKTVIWALSCMVSGRRTKPATPNSALARTRARALATGPGLSRLLPSMGLIGHQWRKHGSCSGLTQRDYFDVTRAARERISIPANSRSNAFPARSTRRGRRCLHCGQSGALARRDRGQVRARHAQGNPHLHDFDTRFRGCREVDSKGCTLDNLEVPEPG
jgi:ribonuclease T2